MTYGLCNHAIHFIGEEKGVFFRLFQRILLEAVMKKVKVNKIIFEPLEKNFLEWWLSISGEKFLLLLTNKRIHPLDASR